MATVTNFEIIVGTYEEYLLGYKVTRNIGKCELKQSFATHEHSSSLRTVASSGKYVASGGADDRICIYDMVARKEHVMLTNHESTVSCVQFTDGHTHLLSSSTDGHLSITRVGNWLVEKLWEKAHKNGYVIDIAIHPSGKLALTLGSDCTLQTWNLIKGRKAYIINLNSKSTDAKSLNFIKWGPGSKKFMLGGGNNLEIWDISTGGILNKFNYDSKVICATWISENIIVIGHENGKLTILDVEENDSVQHDAHKNRIRCLEYINNFLVTCSSSGSIKLWNLHEKELNEICETNTGCRLTCLTLVHGLKVKKEENVEEITEAATINKPKPILTKQRIIIEEGSDEEITDLNTQNKKKKNKKRKQEKQSEIKRKNLQENGKNLNMSSEDNYQTPSKKKKNNDMLDTPNKTKSLIKQNVEENEVVDESNRTKRTKLNNSIKEKIEITEVTNSKKKKSRKSNNNSFSVTPNKLKNKKNKLKNSTENWSVEQV